MRLRPSPRRRSTIRMFESFDTLEMRVLMATQHVLTVALNKDFDQFGDQIVTVQGFETASGVRSVGSGFGIFDTGASAITFSADDAATFQFFENPLPIKNPGGARADGIGGSITGDVSEPVTIVADGLHASALSFDKDGFPQFDFEFTGAAHADAIQAFVGTEAGSPYLPTITGTPLLRPSGINPRGLAAKVDMRGQVLDFSAISPGLVLPFPDVHFVDPAAATLDAKDGVTDAVTIDLHPYGPDNFNEPGDQITSAPNVVIQDVAATYVVDTTTTTADHRQFLFDTGAQISVISTRTATALGLDLANPETIITVTGVAGSQDVPGYTLDTLDVPRRDGGVIEFTNIPVYVLDVADDIDGILGMNAFNTAYQFAFNPNDPAGASLSVSYLIDPDRGDPAAGGGGGSADGNLLLQGGITFGGAFHGRAMPAFAARGIKSTTHVIVSPDVSSPVFGQDVTFTAAVTATGVGPGGDVAFLDGTTLLGTATLDLTGHASLTTRALGVGSHAITASYTGDAAFRGATSIASTIVVTKDNAAVSLASETAPSFGDPLTLDVTLVAAVPGSGVPTGSITITDGLTIIGSADLDATGKATVKTTAQGVGPHTFSAHYSGDGSFFIGVGTLNVTVAKARPAVALTVANAALTFGSTASLSATVRSMSGNPAGQVTFLDGDQVLGSAALNAFGTADLETTDITRVVGMHSISARYSGDASFSAESSPAATVLISRAETTTVLIVSAASTTKGASVAFQAIVTLSGTKSAATGSVAFFDGKTPIGAAPLVEGKSTLVLATLALGGHAISATYSGDEHGSPSSSPTITATITEVAAPPASGPVATTTNLQVSASSIVFGQTVHLVVAVTDSTGAIATGQVSFFDGLNALGTASLSEGIATLDATLIGDPSPHALTARYLGDASSLPSFSPTQSISVAPSDTQTSLTLSPIPSANRRSKSGGTSLKITVGAIAPGAGLPTGQLAVRIGKTTRTIILDHGTARLTLSARDLRARAAIFATYGGDVHFRGSRSLTIKAASQPSGPLPPRK